MLGAHQHSKFPLHHTVVFVGVFDDLLADGDIFLACQVAAINHDTRKAFVDAFLAKFKRIPVIQMNRNRNIGKTHRRLNEFF